MAKLEKKRQGKARHDKVFVCVFFFWGGGEGKTIPINTEQVKYQNV